MRGAGASLRLVIATDTGADFVSPPVHAVIVHENVAHVKWMGHHSDNPGLTYLVGEHSFFRTNTATSMSMKYLKRNGEIVPVDADYEAVLSYDMCSQILPSLDAGSGRGPAAIFSSVVNSIVDRIDGALLG